MTKSELVARLAARYPHLTRRDVDRMVTTVLHCMGMALMRGCRIELRGFGAFNAKLRPSRIGRNPRTGELVPVSQKRAAFFRTGRQMRQRLNAEIDLTSLD